MIRLIPAFTLMLFLLYPAGELFGEEPAEGESSWVPHLELRAGYTGSFWSPKGIEPYQLNTYGRSMAYTELHIVHPFLIISEALDVIDIPSLRLETNFGYTETSGALVEILPDAVRDNPYLAGSGWFTLFQSISLRYRSERFEATIQDPRAFTTGYTGEGIYRVENHLRDLELGLIGSTDGRVHQSMVEIGVFRTWMIRPTLTGFGGSEGAQFPNLVMLDARYDGVYLALDTDAQPDVWPLQTQIMLRLGSMLGVDLRLSFDQPVWRGARLGITGDVSWRSYNYSFDQFGQANAEDSNDRDLRMRVTVYFRARII